MSSVDLKIKYAGYTDHDLYMMKSRVNDDICESSGKYKDRFLAEFREIVEELKRRKAEKEKK